MSSNNNVIAHRPHINERAVSQLYKRAASRVVVATLNASTFTKLYPKSKRAV